MADSVWCHKKIWKEIILNSKSNIFQIIDAEKYTPGLVYFDEGSTNDVTDNVLLSKEPIVPDSNKVNNKFNKPSVCNIKII